MNEKVENPTEEQVDYSQLYHTKSPVKMIKKDGTREDFNVQKVVDAVGKSAYRALTKFTEEEKKYICERVVQRVDELEQDEIPIPIMHNIVESALEEVKPIKGQPYTKGGQDMRPCTSRAPYSKNIRTLSRNCVPLTMESSQNTIRSPARISLLGINFILATKSRRD